MLWMFHVLEKKATKFQVKISIPLLLSNEILKCTSYIRIMISPNLANPNPIQSSVLNLSFTQGREFTWGDFRLQYYNEVLANSTKE